MKFDFIVLGATGMQGKIVVRDLLEKGYSVLLCGRDRRDRRETQKNGERAKGRKKPHKNKPTSKKYIHYKIEGDKIIRGKSCPRCGAGIFLANHKERFSCGKCKYTEFVVKK